MAVNTAPTFSPLRANGKLLIPVGAGNDSASALVQQADGKLIVVGDHGLNTSPFNTQDFAVVRLNVDGSLDTSFNAAGTQPGKLLQDITGNNDAARAVVLQADGKIVLLGSCNNNGNTDMCLVRLNADGTLDTSFNTTGKLVLPVGASADSGNSLALQSDGKLVLGGNVQVGSTFQFAVVRLNADGSLDTSFNTTGKVVLPVGAAGGDNAQKIIVQADGKLVLAGTSFVTNNDFSSLRLNADGSLDTSFGGTGKVILPVGLAGDRGSSAVLQTDGKLLIAGTSANGTNNSDFSVVRLNVDGSLDTSFGGTGKVIFNANGGGDAGQSVTLQSDGKVVVAGTSNNTIVAARLNANGSLDTGFGVNGIVTQQVGPFQNNGISVIQQADGRLVVVGESSGVNRDMAVIRLNLDGSLDTTFGLFPLLTLGGFVNYTEGNPPIALDIEVGISDVELATLTALDGGAGNYAGASVTLARTTGANVDDAFSARGNVVFTAGGDVVVSSVTVGTLTNGAGTLAITFNGNASQARVNEVLSSIGYANISAAPPLNLDIGWTFNDGNTGSQGTGGAQVGTGTVRLQIFNINTAPVNSVPTALQTTLEDTSIVFNTANGNLISVNDPDAGTATIRVTLTVTQGTLTLSGTAGLGISAGANGSATMTISGSQADINTALNGLRYTPSAAYVGGDSLQVVTNDLGRSGGFTNFPLTDTDTVSLQVNAPIATIASVTATSANANVNGTYKLGDLIDITVTFNTVVTVAGGVPSVLLETGAVDHSAIYQSGSGTRALSFRYTVQAGDASADLDYASTAALALNGATLQNRSAQDAVLALAAPVAAGSLGANQAIVVDGIVPTASIVVATPVLAIGQASAVTITFNEAVTGFTNADLTLVNGALTPVSSADGGRTWTATFTPSTNTTAAANTITLANSGVLDAAGNTGAGSTASNSFAIDTQRPVFASASVNANQLVLSYLEAGGLDEARKPAPSDFAVVTNGAANSVVSITVDAAAKTVTLSLTRAASFGDTANVAYTDPTAGNDTNAIQDSAGNDAATLPATTVTNATPEPPNNPPSSLAQIVPGSSTGNPPQQGDLLSLNTRTLTDADGLGVLRFQWLKDGVPISGAASANYLLTVDDVNSSISVAVSYTDGRGSAERVVSAATPRIADNDGVPNEQEALAPPLKPGGLQGDGNGDGVLDTLQVNVTSAQLANSTSFVSVVADSNKGVTDTRDTNQAIISNFKIVAAPGNLPASLKLDFAASFNADVGTRGLLETFSIFVDPATNPNGYWVQDKRGTWNNIATAIEAVEGKTRIDFAITDGGAFDADGVANGIIQVTGGAGNMPLTLLGQPPDLPPGGSFWF